MRGSGIVVTGFAVIALLLGDQYLSSGYYPGGGGDSQTRVARPPERSGSINDYSCKQEANRAVSQLRQIEDKLDRHRRNRELIENKKMVPLFYFQVARDPLKKAYEQYGANGLRRGFDGATLFKKEVSWDELQNVGGQYRWVTEDQAFRYLRSQTGIPKSFALEDFFRTNVWYPAQRNVALLYFQFERREIDPLRTRWAQTIERLKNAGLCQNRQVANQPRTGNCDARLAAAKSQMRQTIAKADQWFNGLRTSKGQLANNWARGLTGIVQQWGAMADRERQVCPAVAEYIETSKRGWIGKVQGEYKHMLEESFR